MYRILTPNGTLIASERIEPVVEKVIKMNGKQQRISEFAEGLKNEPNAIIIHPNNILIYDELYIGNLKPAKVQEIMETLLQDGKYDFSQMQYQDATKVDKLVFDNGESLPCSSEITGFSMPLGLAYTGFNKFNKPCIQSIENLEDDEDEDDFD